MENHIHRTAGLGPPMFLSANWYDGPNERTPVNINETSDTQKLSAIRFGILARLTVNRDKFSNFTINILVDARD